MTEAWLAWINQPEDPHQNRVEMNPVQKMLYILEWMSPEFIAREFGDEVDADYLMCYHWELDLRISGELPVVYIEAPAYDLRHRRMTSFRFENWGCHYDGWRVLLKAGQLNPDTLREWFWKWYQNQIYPRFHWVSEAKRFPFTPTSPCDNIKS